MMMNVDEDEARLSPKALYFSRFSLSFFHFRFRFRLALGVREVDPINVRLSVNVYMSCICV